MDAASTGVDTSGGNNFLGILATLWGIIIAVYFWSLRSAQRIRPVGRSFEYQSVQRKNGAWTRGKMGKLDKLGIEVPKTLYEILEHGLKASGDGKCLGYRTSLTSPYVWLSYSEVLERVKYFGAGLVYLGLKPASESFVGIFARTSPEWVIAEYASYAYSLVTAPIYDSLGPEGCQTALNRLGVTLLICGDDKNFQTLMTGNHVLKKLRNIVFIQSSEETRAKAHALGIQVYQFEDVVELGKKHPTPLRLPRPDDLAMLNFTSGTTGEPKSAMLTHRTLTASVEAILTSMLPLRLNTETTSLAYLPLAHVMERIEELAIFLYGGKVGFNSNGVAHLIEDIQELKPDVGVLVPRVLNRIYGKMMDNIRGSLIKTFIFNLAVFCKTVEMRFGLYRKNSIWDYLIFGKVQKTLGGRIRCVATGSAPQDAKMTNTMKAALGCYFFEIYGQTETAGIITATLPGDPFTGHVGCPVEGMEIKLVDVPELGYYAKDLKGEICARGPLIMSGYYGMPDKTAEIMDPDGFIHTGDVGHFVEGGRLKIIDRKKHIFKLSHGEYVAPERVETELLTSSHFQQIFVDGSSLHPFTVALVYPNYDLLPPEVRSDPEQTKQFLLEELVNTGKRRHLRSYEVPKKIYLLPEVFTLENGFLTPTQKVRREAVRVAFKQQLADMYRGVSLTDN
ncbi:long-chain-fatty-acid--CoA ligase 5-like [Paramacrobiotus metropolitanus]|uniref:long-chain-fatty-acid--CoA ligase 5-like n=1 Tax=Paramacrobiotus metropolitanus TaxID=2943436 RepID=UPI0024464040|nr:long-chain-fatty-acid--CoA ligase 5-like [Paramacrobiotus metropolitanus]